MKASRLVQYVANAPKTPGVYIWHDKHGKPLYIGKAINIRSRLSNYLPAGRQAVKTINPRIRLMVQTASSLTWQETNTDIEALIIESQSIKRLRPRFNITMRDDKQYFYVAFTDEDFPRLILTHQLTPRAARITYREVIGPFTESAPLKSTLRVLRRLFPYCTCKTKHNIRCLNSYIGNCPGYCCLKGPIENSKLKIKNYHKNIRAIRDILTGKRSTLINKMKKEMKSAGKNHDLERAMYIQNQIERVQRVFDNAQINAANQRLVPWHHGALSQMAIEFGLATASPRIEGYDVANIMGQYATGVMVTFIDGQADNKKYRLFNIKSVGGDTAMLNETITRRLTHPEWPLPDLIIVDGGKNQLNAAIKAISKAGLTIPVIALTKNDRHQSNHIVYRAPRNVSTDIRDTFHVKRLSDLPRQLADLIIHVDAEAHRFAIKHYRKRHTQALLG